MKGRNILMGIVLLTSIMVTTVVYSAFSTQLQIKGEAVVRAEVDIRITNVKVISQTNNAYETYNNRYSIDTTSMYVTLPANSSITYEVEITNKDDKDYNVNDIIKLNSTNSNITINMSLEKGDVIDENSKKTFTITLTNNTAIEQIGTVIYQYEFKHIETYVAGTWGTPGTYTFVAQDNGKYKIELWGAQGGTWSDDESRTNYSLGGYTSGEITLTKNTTLYVYVGQTGNTNGTVTFNGGGRGGYGSAAYNGSTSSGDTGAYGYSGGGATDIRVTNGAWNNATSLRSRIMVAAGGGGDGSYAYSSQNSSAGGLTGYKGNYWQAHGDLHAYGFPGTQTAGGAAGTNVYSAQGTTNAGSFGVGGSAYNYSAGSGSGGGGGGWYGGGAGGGTCQGGSGHGGGGGSSYISGHNGCRAVNSSGTVQSGSNSYTGYVFTSTSTLIIDGQGYKWTTSKGSYVGQTQPNGTTAVGHSGNGYARITYLG